MSKLKITVGTPAYNEAANIKNMLEQLAAQKQDTFEIVEIIVASDGSTDETVKKTLELNDPKIRVLDNKDRKGKTQRVNDIFREAKGDVIVIIDADVVPTSTDTISKLIEPFITDSEVVYASGALVPMKPTTFIESAFIVSRSVWDKLRLQLKSGQSVYTCHGALYALRADFAKANPYPDKLWTDIGFHYLTCILQNRKYISVKQASVNMKLPTTVKDYLSQVRRYHREGISIRDHFGSWVDKEYAIPKTLLYKYKAEVLLKYPLQSLTIFVLNFYSKYLGGKAKKDATANWTMIASTKLHKHEL